jgi:hypothetical protein
MSSVAVPKATPYDAAVEEVRSNIEELRTTLATLLRLQSEYSGAPSPGTRGGDAEISHDTFFNMTIADAAKKYLGMVKATKSTADIAESLERGGLKHSSKDFPTTVRSILGPREDFTRVPNGDWGLADWYPGMGRGKKPKAEKPTKTGSRRKAKGARSKAAKPKLEDQIVTAMKTDPGKDWTSAEVATALDAQRTSVQSTMSRMGKDGTRITKADRGYRLAKLLIGAA